MKPDLEEQVSQSDKDGEEIEIEDKSQSDFLEKILIVIWVT